MCVLIWVLPLFAARPLTAPIHNPTDHMMPPAFPLLLVAPAMVLDWLHRRARFTIHHSQLAFVALPRRREFGLACAAGACFFAVFLPVQWFFAKFLLSPLADNWFFAGGGRHWPFFLKIDQARVMFWGLKQDPLTWRTASVALLLAIISSWAGLRAAAWLSRLRR